MDPVSHHLTSTVEPSLQARTRTVLPFYDTIDLTRTLLLLFLAAQSVSLWFVTAGNVRITSIPADALYYARLLPYTYWWGLAASIGLLLSASLFKSRMRTFIEILSLFIISLYVIGLPSFVYENSRILDVYVHMSNTLIIVDGHGWMGSTDWYVRQFPGAYTYFAQYILTAGFNPFDVMKYYPVACSWMMIILVYTLVRMFNPLYAGRMAALSVGGFWFQLHLCPQSLELIPYLALVFVFIKIAADPERRNVWTFLALASVPVFVVSHPESDAVMILGLAGLILFARLLPAGRKLLGWPVISKFVIFLVALLGMFTVWWFTYASEARVEIGAIAFNAINHVLAGRTAPPQTIPVSPAYSYQLTILLEQGVAVAVWLLGIAFFFLSRLRWSARDFPVWGLFLAALSTVVVTFQVRADMLQRSYLFSMLPAVIVFGAMMANRPTFKIRGRSLYSLFSLGLLLAMVCFLVLMPVTRNGVDPYEYTPQSSAFASSVAAQLSTHSNSVLFLSNGENSWRFYSALDGNTVALRDEQNDMVGLSGGFTKVNSASDTATQAFNVPFTLTDHSVNYIMLSDFYGSLYVLRLGPNSGYLNQKGLFEHQVSVQFNLVYSTGTDRIYGNPNPPAASG